MGITSEAGETLNGEVLKNIKILAERIKLLFNHYFCVPEYHKTHTFK